MPLDSDLDPPDHRDDRPERVCVGDTTFDNVTMAEAIERIDALIQARRPAFVITPNLDHVFRARRQPEYAQLLCRADLVLADGQPIVWVSRLLGTPLPQRVAGSDLLPELCRRAAQVGHRVVFMGGDPGAADAARTVLQDRYPGLQVVGTHCPPMGFENDPEQRRRAVAAVREAQPDVVFVGLGSPKQERWIAGHQHEYGPAVSIGIGISFSFVAGHVQRAPVWVQRIGFEWLHRVCMEPRRLWKRYFNCACSLPALVLRDLYRVRRRRRLAGSAGH